MTPAITIRRQMQKDLYGEQMIPDICIGIRMALNGSGDPLPREKLVEAERFLTLVDGTWYNTPDNDYGFDSSVRLMVKATLTYLSTHFVRNPN